MIQDPWDFLSRRIFDYLFIAPLIRQKYFRDHVGCMEAN